MRAYVLLKVQPKETDRIMSDLMALDSTPIKRVCMIHGPYDCIVELESRSLQAINDVVERIRVIDGVSDTLTCLVMRTHEAQRRRKSVLETMTGG